MSDPIALREEYRNQLCHCSFCAKAQSEVTRLVAGPGVYICDACIALCNQVIANAPDRNREPEWRYINYLQEVATDDLKTRLGGIERLHGDINVQQQMTIDVLRSRKVSWAEIGNALGITRQAAWQRFGAADAATD
ncbi:MAG TPA: ClpX C4-type zinc finger protein [Pseudomonadales bacterium]|nr:ClpX C4-type zinc finger protein [Pseudomonadales bacterium]